VLLATVFAATWFVNTAIAVHLPRLLQSTGATPATAVAVRALIGPAQVGGRLLEFGLLRRLHPRKTLPDLPWLVSEGSQGSVNDHVDASKHRERPAYQWSTDVTA
jgi:hypothetical protein